jgi:uncharacterized protein YbaR (Trm112 family)
MALDNDLLELMVCPDSREKLSLADASLVAQLNARVEKGELTNRAGDPVEQKLDAALVRDDGEFAYSVIDDIPNLIVDEGIPLQQLADPKDD